MHRKVDVPADELMYPNAQKPVTALSVECSTSRPFGYLEKLPLRKAAKGSRNVVQIHIISVEHHFCRIERNRPTWILPSPLQRWIQIDHIAICHRWHGLIEGCCSLGSIIVDSYHGVIVLTFVCF